MRSNIILIALGASLAGCTAGSIADNPARGIAAVNVPVVTTANYVFDAAAPDGSLAPGEAERLDGWFRTLGLGYGDSIYIDGASSDLARSQVADVAGRYGMLVSAGAPMTAGMVQPGAVRVVVARRRAEVPNCPNWSVASQPDYLNRTMSNFGCSVSTNMAAMVADPEDLVHGREGSGVGDIHAGTKAIEYYRTNPPTGAKGLQDVNTKKDSQ